ncbi:hypothetical protein PVAND_003777 [Polypedilum vanderplanki]|uniref:Rad60/SUMO-like domain-containing protein n=1 Tax=Polypedilum vanderplanki TaxID=319348 RepID=A0A9J6BW62_POLVA|nr:hypothetical protein PVAND_003777 [Polypedilum vanderplanki]
MADIFGKLNAFLNKDSQDDSFNYDVNDSSNDSPIVSTKSQNQADVISVEDNLDDSSCVQESKKPGRKRKATQTLNDPDESFDLTGDFYEKDSSSFDHNINIGKSRRKLADEICVINTGQVDLCDIEEDTSSVEFSGTGRGKRGKGKKTPPKVRKPRKMSYKKALEIIKQPLPDINANKTNTIQVPSTIPSSSSRSIITRLTDQNLDAVDLTGEFVMGPQHSKAPLFQNKTSEAKKSKQSNNESIDKNNSMIWEEDDDIDSIKINVRIKDSVKKFKHYSNRRFYDLFKIIAESEKVPISSVFFYLNDKRIYPEDMPEEIGHKISTIYNCTLMDSTTLEVTNRKDKIELKFQSDKWKRPISLKVSRVDKFSNFLKNLYEQIGFTPKQIFLCFDGEPLDIDSTPMENELEGGEIIDCRVNI